MTISVNTFDTGGTGGWIGTVNIHWVHNNTNSNWKCLLGGYNYCQYGSWSQVNEG